MSDTRGGDSERIAPIIPLFGDSSRKSGDVAPPSGADSAGEKSGHRAGAELWRSTWDEPPASAAGADRSDGTPSERHPARGASARTASERSPSAPAIPRLRALPDTGTETADVDAADDRRATAEEALVRKLRARSLSVSEARTVLRGHELDAGAVDDVIDDFCRRGYLDDDALASALVTSGVERKGQGRVALSRSLSQRGIPRDVIDRALDELPDDDDERALDFARTKARSLSRLDPDTALRRLVGQLARRGYNGAVAMKAAKTALRETTFGSTTSGVRFVDSD